MFEITKEISFEEVLEKIEEAKNIGILGFVFAIFAIVLVAMLVCLFFDTDKVNEKKIANLESLLEQELEKNRALEYRVRFYCDHAIYLRSDNGKKGKRK